MLSVLKVSSFFINNFVLYYLLKTSVAPFLQRKFADHFCHGNSDRWEQVGETSVGLKWAQYFGNLKLIAQSFELKGIQERMTNHVNGWVNEGWLWYLCFTLGPGNYMYHTCWPEQRYSLYHFAGILLKVVVLLETCKRRWVMGAIVATRAIIIIFFGQHWCSCQC